MTYLFEEAKTIYKRRIDSKFFVHTSGDAARYFKGYICPDWDNLTEERMFAIYTNRRNRIVAYAELSIGTDVATLMPIKKALKIAADSNASAIVMLHNHPSNNSNPSEADKNITKKFKTACEYLDLNLMDHVIIADNYYSFADEGLL